MWLTFYRLDVTSGPYQELFLNINGVRQAELVLGFTTSQYSLAFSSLKFNHEFI